MNRNFVTQIHVEACRNYTRNIYGAQDEKLLHRNRADVYYSAIDMFKIIIAKGLENDNMRGGI